MVLKPWTDYEKAEDYCRRDSKCKFIYNHTGLENEFFICCEGTTLVDALGERTTAYGKGNSEIIILAFQNS